MAGHTIFFDWDGTLADSMDVCVEGIRLACARLSLPCPEDELIYRCNGPAYDACIGILGVPASIASTFLRVRAQAEMEVLDRTQRLFPGVREMLQELSRQATLCIVSNGLQDYLDRSLQVTGIAGFFERAQARIDGLQKPEVLRRMIQEGKPSSAVMIGDCRGDIEAGKANGLRTIGAAYGYGKREEWSLADQIAYSVEELVPLALPRQEDRL